MRNSSSSHSVSSTRTPSHRRPSIVPLVKRNSLIKEIISNTFETIPDNAPGSPASLSSINSDEFSPSSSYQRRGSSFMRKMSLQQTLNMPKEIINTVKKSDVFLKRISIIEEESIKLSPKVEGRIRIIKH